jgi:two-component system OmpR family response regulator
MQHILLVDDNTEILDIVAQAVAAAGYRVSSAGRMSQATAILEADDIDMLITDIVLPDGNGTTLARRAEGLGVPALVITGNPHWLLALADARLDYLHKPFRTWQVVERIRSRLGSVAAAG